MTNQYPDRPATDYHRLFAAKVLLGDSRIPYIILESINNGMTFAQRYIEKKLPDDVKKTALNMRSELIFLGILALGIAEKTEDPHRI